MKNTKWLSYSGVWQKALICLLVAGIVLAAPGRLLARPYEEVHPLPAAGLAAQEMPLLPPATNAAEQVAPPPSFTGDIRAKERIMLASKAPARIKQVRGEVGDLVKGGDLLIELDHDVLDAQIKQGEAALSLAEAQLSKLLSGSRKEQIAIAEANLASAQADLDLLLVGSRKEQIDAARSALKAAQAQLDLLLAGPSEEVRAVAEAQVKLAETQEVLRTKVQEANLGTKGITTGLQPYSAEMIMFQDVVGQLSVELARAQLRAVTAPARPQQVAQLEANVEASKTQVDLLGLPPRSPEVEKKKAAVEIARQQLELAKSPNTENDLAAAAAAVLQAQAAFQALKTGREDFLLTAPFDGFVAVKHTSAGALVMPGEPIVTFISSDVEAVFTLGEADYARVRSGQGVTVTLPAYPGQSFTGSVRAISPQADPATRRFNVYVTVSDREGKFRPGMFASVAIS
ncbi:MAG: efflux RND transporter periplasmic adaptor subunit [Chloroflexi bacterium]|nr:efflux RND transporter periplasmic adaptor subunit [Chloroflexota bacterium]